LQTGEAKVPQPFNNFEDHSHELGGPPIPTKTTQKPKGRKNKAKDNEVSQPLLKIILKLTPEFQTYSLYLLLPTTSFETILRVIAF
jgi:hypothetical protein